MGRRPTSEKKRSRNKRLGEELDAKEARERNVCLPVGIHSEAGNNRFQKYHTNIAMPNVPSHRRATVVVKESTVLHARPRALGG